MNVGQPRRAITKLAVVLVIVLSIPSRLDVVQAGGDMTAHAAQPAEVTRIQYGGDPGQFADLWLPAEVDSEVELPVVVLVHGGFWRALYGLDLMEPLAADLVARGYAVWNIEYRRVGDDGGGWPGTLVDVATAIDKLDALGDQPLDLDDVTLIGHSAGGHLAFWAAGRDGLRPGQPGAHPLVMPRLVIGQGPVGDLVEAARLGAGNGAVIDFIGGQPDEFPERYDIANPLIGADVEVVVIRGTRDTIVSAAYTVPHAQGTVSVVDVEGDDHFDLIDPRSDSWARVIEALAAGDADRASPG